MGSLQQSSHPSQADGRWLVFEFVPVTLFSLKASFATSSVGHSLLVPTPYAIKMAFVDAGFRAGIPTEDCGVLLHSLATVEVRVRPPVAAVVTHTFVKVRQRPKTPSPEEPFQSSIAFRDVVHHQGAWYWAFDLSGASPELRQRLLELAPLVRYVGKRGSFIQYRATHVRDSLSSAFTQPVSDELEAPALCHFVSLDDFGPEADLETLSSYSPKTAKRDEHRRFVRTMVPLGVINAGPGFTQYAAAPSEPANGSGES